MKRGTGIAILAAAAAMSGCGTQEVLLGTRGSYLFTAMDALAVPGQETLLRAQLRGGDMLRGRGGYAVRFYRDGKLYKVAETDGDGIAAVSYTPEAPGDHVFTAELAPIGLAEEPPEPLELLLACRAPDTPMLVVDLDKTVVATGFHTVLIGSPAPMADSQRVLARLARQRTIVYLTHRPDYFSLKSKAWLREHKYPPGPLLLSTPGGFLKGSGAYKSEMLKRLRKRFRKIEIGIGDKISDAQAYHENGLKAFLILPPPEPAPAAPEKIEALADDLEALDEKVQVVTHWRQIEQVLFEKASHPRSAMQRRLRKLAAEARATLKASEAAKKPSPP
jgi:hypothetical protein